MKMIICTLLISITSALQYKKPKCDKLYHYWRPFFGEYQEYDYIAAMSEVGKRTYIGKIIPKTEKRSWTVSTQLTYDFVEFAWEDNKIIRVYDFIEIMGIHPEHEHNLAWLKVLQPFDLLGMSKSYCLVEGGIVNYRRRIIYSYIGRVLVNGSFFIGPVYLEDWAMKGGMHYLDGWKKKLRVSRFQVLAYMH